MYVVISFIVKYILFLILIKEYTKVLIFMQNQCMESMNNKMIYFLLVLVENIFMVFMVTMDLVYGDDGNVFFVLFLFYSILVSLYRKLFPS